MVASLFDVNKQLSFYGAYHSNRVNILIHMICVPLLLWSAQVMAADLPLPAFIPKVHYKINDFLEFDLNTSAIHAAIYLAYYFVLEPVAALLYVPQMALSLTSATSFANGSGSVKKAFILHVISWLAQFAGHGLAEGRAPALLDNLLGAAVLAPFFVHLEILFGLGYKPEMHKRIQNDIGKEITKFRKAKGDKLRAQKKEL